jgi:hypothetical protein
VDEAVLSFLANTYPWDTLCQRNFKKPVSSFSANRYVYGVAPGVSPRSLLTRFNRMLFAAICRSNREWESALFADAIYDEQHFRGKIILTTAGATKLRLGKIVFHRF